MTSVFFKSDLLLVKCVKSSVNHAFIRNVSWLLVAVIKLLYEAEHLCSIV